MVGLADVIQYLYPAARPLIDFTVSSANGADTITQWSVSALGAQPTEPSLATTQASQAYLDYSTPQAAAARETASARSVGQEAVDNDHTAGYKVHRAVASVAIDEINTLRQWIGAFKTQVAAASTLADLKTRVAGLPNLPDRTLAQAKTAIKSTIASGGVD